MLKLNALSQKIDPYFIIFLSIVLIAFVNSDNRGQNNLPLAVYSVCAGDIDTDGDKDILVGHLYNQTYNWGGISILNNKGFGIYESDSFYLYDHHRCVLLQNLDSNNYLDLITQYSDGQYPSIAVLSDVVNNQTIILTYPLDHYPDRLECGDFNGDGAPDITFVSNNDKFWGVLYNDGTGHFTPPEYLNLTYPPQGFSTGDLNGDGRDDIAICSQTIEVYFSYPAGFQKLIVDSIDFRHRIKIVDFDLDGHKDLFTIEDIYGIITYYNVFKNNGDNTFEKLSNSSFQPGGREFIAKDFNNDSLPDVAFLLDNNTGYFIYYNQGNFQLADSQFVAIPDYGYGELWRNCTGDDLDNNGFNDIITTRFAYIPLPSNLDILFNDGQGHFVPDPIVMTSDRKNTEYSPFSSFPNPFHDITTFTFEIKETADVELSVYNLQGKFCTSLIRKKMKGGCYSIKWRGLDQGGQPCKPGAFVAYLMVNGKITDTEKIFVTQ